MDISDARFNEIISQAMDELPQDYIRRLSNVLITYEDEPTIEQRHKLRLRCSETLLGLYEGIPLPARGDGYNLVLPDRITLFKIPLLHSAGDEQELAKQVKHTLWHEIAHYYGLDHNRIHAIERDWR